MWHSVYFSFNDPHYVFHSNRNCCYADDDALSLLRGVKVPVYYQYSWEVKDAPSGNDYRQQETRDGHLTTGLYQVLLPGGRHQVMSQVSLL